MVLLLAGQSGHNNDKYDGPPAHSHHDKNPPWWEFVSNDYGGNMPVTKSHHMIMMMMKLGWVMQHAP